MSQFRVDVVDAVYTKVKVCNLEPRSKWIKWPVLINDWATLFKSKGRNYISVVLSSRRIIGDGNGIHLWALRMREISLGSGSRRDMNEWGNSFKLDSLKWHFGHRHKRNFCHDRRRRGSQEEGKCLECLHPQTERFKPDKLAHREGQESRDDVLNTANNSFL